MTMKAMISKLLTAGILLEIKKVKCFSIATLMKLKINELTGILLICKGMNIEFKKRPWEPRTQTRYNPDKRYQGASWQKTKKIHKSKSTTVTKEEFDRILEINPKLAYTNGTISNLFCIDCYKEGRLKEMHTVDHHVRVKDGADFYDEDNLRSLCESHHARKSAKESQL